MRTWPSVGLLILTTLVLKVSLAEDLYWEGEDDSANEFLEVKEDSSLVGHLQRFKRDFWDPFSIFTPSSTTTPAPENEINTEDPDDVDDEGEGSGSAPESRPTELEATGEKTLRVTFVVMQPYQVEYSNRDSPQFQKFSATMAQAVNVLFDNLPGTQKASLIRIQSRLADNFSCKVTMEIVTIGYDNTDKIKETLREHIRNFRYLGNVAVKDDDFSASVVNPGSPFETCGADQIQCDDGFCISESSRCDGTLHCSDGSDEQGCPPVDEGQPQIDQQLNEVDSSPSPDQQPLDCERIPCASSSVTICVEQRCNHVEDCPSGDDEMNCPAQPTEQRTERGDQPLYTTTVAPVDVPPPETTPFSVAAQTCLLGEFRCDDNSRCIAKSSVCDQINDCFDGTDELNCPEECGVGDFRCDDGKCIESRRRCDRVSDCVYGEDERDCACGSDEFQCISDGACIEARKRCDGLNHCRDGTDELDCACTSDQWQCDQGNCIPRSKRCNGRVDCPSDRSDERHCVAKGHFKCKSGKIIPETLRCNRRYDCPDGDYSDEKNCPCGDKDFKCKNGHCIPKTKRCDRTRDCQDGSDELYCSYGKECMAYEFKCTDGQCVHAESRCNGTAECDDTSDEISCPCKRGQFRCHDGSCINIALRCNGHRNCVNGEDETNCGGATCPADKFTCDSGSVQCATRCDGFAECENNEDEDGCQEDACQHECDGRCLEDAKICNGVPDCFDGSDEQVCDNCDGPDDFRCDNNDCISARQRCNNVQECIDGSDELNCNETMIASNSGCSENQFKCRDGTCINAEFYCDGRVDCVDSSDEIACSWYMLRASRSPPLAPCLESEFTCYEGRCIPNERRCDNIYDCSDFSDEQNCYAACNPDEFKCISGECIPSYLKCDGMPDCSDRSDESDSECSSGGRGYTTEYQSPVDRGYTSTARTDPDVYTPGREPNGPNRPEPSNPNQYSPYAPGTGPQPDNRYPTYGGSDDRRPSTRPPYGEEDSNTGGGSGSRTTVSPDGGARYDPYNPPRGYDQSGPTTSSPDVNYDPYNPRPGYPQPASTTSSPEINDPYGGSDRFPSRDPYSDRQRTSTSAPSTASPGGGDQGHFDPYNSRPGYPSPVQTTSSPDINDPNAGRPYDRYGPSTSAPSTASPDGNRPAYPYNPYNPQPRPYPPSTSAPGGNGDRQWDNSQSGSGSTRGVSIACQRHEWRCENGPCIDAGRRCDGRVDCPFDLSDEFDCPAGSPAPLQIKTYPSNQTIRYGGDVVFQCRDEGPLRAPVRWVREGARPLKPGARDFHGRLEIDGVTAGDAGVYICQTPGYLSEAGSEKRVTLTVQRKPGKEYPQPHFCAAHEATCGNGQCIDKSRVCDGRFDCTDRSDENMCSELGRCEPNQFQCDNRKCVLKTWLCDSEDDCGDNSDERRCGSVPGQPCLPSEFACSDGNQCIPRSFHCDQRSDCFDKSDEVGCAEVYIVKAPTPANLRLNTGDTLVLRAEAKGNPVPIISWRLNWGHVPANCTSTSENGVGVLTCYNMQPEHSGAYSAEALNNKGTTFANPDAIVFVTQISPCPPGYFNNEARSRDECIKCFCFGESTTCRSADLFTYNMPTPLGQGGTRLQGVTITPGGEIRQDPSIVNHYYYQPLRNGAIVTKLASYDGGSLGSFHPYLALPETYYGQQLTSYGGHIKYSIAPHSRSFDFDDSAPSIIIKGKYKTLFHLPHSRNEVQNERIIHLEVQLTPDFWVKPGRYEFEPASREDIMMALDDIETILLRADLNNGGVNITNFVMESAQSINVGLGAAALVEECTCPPGYEGLSCQKCAAGYVRENSGPWLGSCVRESCPSGTYGDPSRGMACLPCPCPLTNRENQFASTCRLGADGLVTCDCNTGYEGDRCEICSPGYEGNPLVPGDSCRQKPNERCNPAGTESTRLLGECSCKENVQGRYCDQCKNNSFYLSNDFRQGCALCFCTGLSTQCMSSNLRRKTTSVNFNAPNLVDQVRVYSSNPEGALAAYGAPDLVPELKPVLTSGGLTIRGYDTSRSSVLYWSMPFSFAGDKVTSYGGYLKYVLDNVPSYIVSRSRNNVAADVILVSVNHLTFQYFGDFRPSPEGVLNASVQFLESAGWRRSDGMEISREHFLLALADVKDILIKATYGNTIATPLSASIETAEPNGNGPAALHVEQCVCPTGYIGTSCEDCAPGFTRTLTGLYLENCVPCDCNGHSRECHPDNGDCYNCMDNTDGPRCELCKPGYERDAYDNCVEVEGPSSTSVPCRCDPRGSEGPCDASGRCQCKANVEGPNCDRCRAGTFGLEARNPEGCIPCFCSGVTQECQEANHYVRIAVAAPIFGDDNGGYTLTDINSENVYKDEFVPQPDKSELMYIFPFPPSEELYWSLPVFPGNRVTSYGGSISLRQEFVSNDNAAVSEPGTDVVLAGDTISVYWINPHILRSSQSLSYQVPLTEQGWYRLGSTVPASRSDFMRVLKTLRQVLVRATIARDIASTSIADVSMDTAAENPQPGAIAALGVELCTCPPGHLGTSCESCAAGYYKDDQDYCQICPCSGHDCQLDTYGQVTCNCRPPYTGRDCTAIVGESQGTTSRPPPQSTVSVRIINQDVIRIEEIGSSVNFTCQASSRINNNPLPITWAKLDGYLPQDRVYVDTYSGFLKITNLQISDSGVYICQSNDGVSTASQTVTLQVPANAMTHPTVSITPAVADFYEGDQVVLQCDARGNPMPSVSWRRTSQRPLPLTSTVDGPLFIIDNVKREDSGEYSCRASNSAGSDESIAVINIRERPSRPPRERLMVTPQAPVVYEGQSTRVVCTGSASVPAGTIDWVRQDNQRFQPNVRSDNGVLYIEVATSDNQGVYICQTQSADVVPVPILVTVNRVNTPPPGERSNITVATEYLKIASGESGTIDCTPSGYPLPRVNWTKHQGDFGRGTSQRGDTLIINNAQETDAGYYVCKGFVEGQPRPVAIIYVNVEIERRELPRVQIYPEGEQPAALNSTFEFHCRVSGIPEPDVTWSRSGGRELSRTTQIMPKNILRFEKVDVNDEGEYICTGTNIVGSSSASAVIKVRAPPVINITPTNYLTVQYGEPLRMECRANGYPDPMVSIRGPDRRELAAPSPVIATIRIPSATERDDGVYTCLATSEAGSLEETFAVRVNRGDSYPDVEGSGENEIFNTADPNYNPYYDPNSDPNYDPNYNNERPNDLNFIEGKDQSEVDCPSVPGGYGARWDRSDRQPLQSNAVQEGNKLVIYNASSADNGEYVCSLYNSQTEDVQVARYIRILVVRPPRITLRPQNQTVLPGQSPTVECIVDGDEIQSIQWRPLNRNPSRRIEIRNSTLIFHQIEVEDAGEYECFVKNRYANASATAKVIVAENADGDTSISHENEQWVRPGATVSLSCNMTQRGNTVSGVSVHWTKDGNTLPRTSRVRPQPDGSLIIRFVQKSDSGLYVCYIRDAYGRETTNYTNLHIEDKREPAPQLVQIDQSRRRFMTGENVQIACRALYRNVDVNWQRFNTNQFVDSRRFGDGAMLIVNGVTPADEGKYRCEGTDLNGRKSYQDFDLRVEPGQSNPSYPRDRNVPVAKYTALLGDSIEMPCNHDLEGPVNINWKRLYVPLPSHVRSDQPILYLNNVTEAAAGTYICRVSNNRATVEARAILRIVGIVPSFNGNSWAALPTISDAYRQFDIEVSFKPTDSNGLILYNSENPSRFAGDFLALQLEDYIPVFILETGNGPIYVKGDRPLTLNEWHTIRLNRIGSEITMAVDNLGPFTNMTAEDWVLDLRQPLYVGGVQDANDLPPQLAGASGFVGCVSLLVIGREDVDIMTSNIDRRNLGQCNTCSPNLCLNDGICQEARNERGFVCICSNGYAGQTCERQGEACHPGLCGPGKCQDTADGYKCACPVTHTGRNCEETQSVEYPAFTGSAYLALDAPNGGRFFKLSMKVKPTYPVQDGIIMYCAESKRGLGGFTSLAVRNQRLEFRYDLNDGFPIVLRSNTSLPARDWTDVQITRAGPMFSLTINAVQTYEQRRDSANKSLNIKTPMFVGGVDETITLNNNTGVIAGFNGCIKDVATQGNSVNIVTNHNYSGNVQDCNMIDHRGDIPEENPCNCLNGGVCNADGTCSCPPGTSGYYCESRGPSRQTSRRPGQTDPCAARPCRNGGTCRVNYSYTNMMNHTCDCPLGFSGANCQIGLNLYHSVSFNGDGYLELPANLLTFEDDNDPATIALAIMTTQNGVLLYQKEMTSALDDYGSGDFVLLRIDRGYVVLDWDMGSGATSLTVDSKFVTDGERHEIIVRFLEDTKVELTVDDHPISSFSNGFANRMNVDSNIYIGGIPERLNVNRYPGLMGCIEQVEFMNGKRPVLLGEVAVAGKNAQRCRQPIR